MVKASRKQVKKEKTAAILTIHAPGKMNLSGRKAIAEWLAIQSVYLLQYGKEYTTGRYTARYLYR